MTRWRILLPLDPISTIHPVTGAVRPVTPDLLAETYLCPVPPAFDDAAAIAEARRAPWAGSLVAAQQATSAAVGAALRDLVAAAPSFDPASIEAERLPEGRARAHLLALRDLWADLGTLPSDLAPFAHAERCGATEALEALPIHAEGNRTGATAADLRLSNLLERHHGAGSDPGAFPGLCPAGRDASLQAFQTGAGGAPSYDLRVTMLRDPLEELRHAAARAQRLLDESCVEAACEIGLLMPDDPAWTVDAESVFAAVGLHLGGLPGPPERDRAGEAVHLLLTVLRKPVPGMAEVALDALGLAVSGAAREALKQAPASGAELSGALRSLARHVPAPVARGLRALPIPNDGAPIDWDGLIATARPGATTGAPRAAAANAISVFLEGQRPWREVRYLIAIGFAGSRYPSVPGGGPFWLEHEIDLIEDCCGIALPGRRLGLAVAAARLNRQLSCASEGIEITLPVRDRAGARLSPAAALDVMAHRLRCRAGDLIRPLPDDPAEWRCASHMPAEIPGGGRPRLPRAREIELERDLTALRQVDGVPAAQSPSRLETLLVSPLAWLLEEVGVEERGWAPDRLDAMVRGSVVHRVLEMLFPPGSPPDPAAVTAAVPAAVEAAIGSRGDLRFLQGQAWAVERAQLVAEMARAAPAWAQMLHEAEATIEACEEMLEGKAFGLSVRGKPDMVLRLKGGARLVIDYKSGGARDRATRMEAGWDVQAHLYGEMIGQGGTSNTSVGAGYLSVRDMAAVTANGTHGAAFGGIEGDGHAEATAALTTMTKGLREGRITLNGADDAEGWKDVGITAYALDGTLVSAFLWEDDA